MSGEQNVLFDGLLGQANPKRCFAQLMDGRTYSYQDVLDVSGRLANTLWSLGVRPGDRVAMQVPKSLEALMLYLATIRVGAVFLPLNTAYTADEVRYFLEDAEPSLFVCAPEDRSAFEAIAARSSITLETLGVWRNHETSAGTLADAGLAAPKAFETIARAEDDLGAILYTSGTTGRSKGAMLTHRNLLSNTEVLTQAWRFSHEDVLLHALPIFHTHGLFVATNVTLLAGASMIYLERFDLDTVIARLASATTMMGVPTFYVRLLEDPRFTREVAKNVRLFVSGSAPLLAETHVRFEERTGHRILERYGMTETGMNSSNPYEGDRRAGTVGFPLRGTEIKVADPETGRELPQGDVGSIEVRGPNVFTGYWRNPEKTAEEFRSDGYFITGDLGSFDADGYLTISGRSKDLIISGGFNVYPKEIETAIDDMQGVKESAVIGVAHPDFGEGVVAVVVGEAGGAVDADGVLQHVAGRLAKFKQPKRIFILDDLPRNAMGKVQKNILRDRFASIFSDPKS